MPYIYSSCKYNINLSKTKTKGGVVNFIYIRATYIINTVEVEDLTSYLACTSNSFKTLIQKEATVLRLPINTLLSHPDIYECLLKACDHLTYLRLTFVSMPALPFQIYHVLLRRKVDPANNPPPQHQAAKKRSV